MCAVGAGFEATARVTAPRFIGRWCRRYAACFSAVGAVFYTTTRLNAPQILAVGVGVMLPILLLLVPSFTPQLGSMLPKF